MSISYYDRDGTPMTMMAWAMKLESAEARDVAFDEMGDVHVSTVWIGLNHNWGSGAPLIFETMIFGGVNDQYQERYATEEQALAGHERIVNGVTQGETL